MVRNHHLKLTVAYFDGDRNTCSLLAAQVPSSEAKLCYRSLVTRDTPETLPCQSVIQAHAHAHVANEGLTFLTNAFLVPTLATEMPGTDEESCRRQVKLEIRFRSDAYLNIYV